MRFYIFAILASGCIFAQPLQISLGIDANLTELEPSISAYQSAFENLVKGLSIEEAAQNFPTIFNQTVYSLNDGVTADGFLPVYEGIYRSPNGIEIITQVFNDTRILLTTFVTMYSNADVDFASDIVKFSEYGLSLAIPLLAEPFRPFAVQLVSTIETAFVLDANISEIAPVYDFLKTTIDTALDIEDLGFDSDIELQDVVIEAYRQSLQILDIGDEPGTTQAIGDLFEVFFDEVQKQLGFNEKEFLEFMSQVFGGIIDQLLFLRG